MERKSKQPHERERAKGANQRRHVPPNGGFLQHEARVQAQRPKVCLRRREIRRRKTAKFVQWIAIAHDRHRERVDDDAVFEALA